MLNILSELCLANRLAEALRKRHEFMERIMFNSKSDCSQWNREWVAYPFVRHLLVGVLILLLTSQGAERITAQQPGAAQQQGTPSTQQAQPPLPDAPSPAPTDPQVSDQSQPSTNTPQSQNPKPVGTAAAPYMKPSGTAASRPAGAAIAPGKQKRVRSVVIKYGLIAGAAVAGGVVVALSAGSRSRPQ